MDQSPFHTKRDDRAQAAAAAPLDGRQPPLLPPQVVLTLQEDDLDNGASGGAGAVARESPEETGSLYSDEIPSGYNSGEQYDTISTGYTSGEAYELPDTRMDLHEPNLEKIDECLQSLGGAHDDDIFVMPGMQQTHGVLPESLPMQDNASMSSSSTDSTAGHPGEVGGVAGEHAARSPTYGPNKTKLRKKVTTFSIPIESTPLGDDDDDENFGFDPESSDPGMGTAGASAGYSGLPSDTDTSAFDSDANALTRNPDSGTELLQHASLNKGSKAARMAARKAKKLKKHDEDWFNANDNKYWSVARTFCFWGAILGMVGSTVAAGIMIYLMPINCEPSKEWFQGAVMMDIRPKVDNMFLDLRAEGDNLHTYRSLGVQMVHLKNLTATAPGKYHPTADFESSYRRVFGDNASDVIRQFVSAAHNLNLSVMIQIPLVGIQNETDSGELSLDLTHSVSKAIEFWARLGVDGIFLDGLEHFGFGTDDWVPLRVAVWQSNFDRFGTSPRRKVLMTSYKFAQHLVEGENPERRRALSHIGLLDATLDLDSENVTQVGEEIARIAAWDVVDGQRPWINWNLHHARGGLSHAALAFQMLLPGTINLGPLDGGDDELFQSDLGNLTSIRTLAVPIYMNGNYKRCDCEEGTTKEINFKVSQPLEDLVQLERFYSRRNRYVLVANFGSEDASLENVGKVYSVGELLFDTSREQEAGLLLAIREQVLAPGHAIVIKLPM